MKRPYKHIDLEDKFSDFEFTPNDSAWNNISGGLNSGKAAGSLADKFNGLNVDAPKKVWKGISSELHPKRKKRIIAFWWTGAGVAASLIAFMFIFNNSGSQLTEKESDFLPRNGQLAADGRKADLNSNSISEVNSESESNLNETFLDTHSANYFEELASGIEKFNANNSSGSKKLNFNSTSGNESSSDLSLVNHEQDQTIQSISDLTHSGSQGIENDSIIYFKVKILGLESKSGHLASNLVLEEIKNNYFSPILSLPCKPENHLLAIIQLNEPSGFNGNSSWFAADGAVENQDSDNPESFNESINDLTTFGFSSAEEFSVPLNLSLRTEKSISKCSDRFRLGAGVGALLVRSKVTQNFNSTSIAPIVSEMSIKRNYLTVPVYLKYNILNKRRVHVYSSLGIQSEFSINGRRISRDFQSNSFINTVDSKIEMGIGQFNANMGLGTEFRIKNRLSAMAEFSVSHYFSQSHYTIWSNQKFWPSIKTGLVFRY